MKSIGNLLKNARKKEGYTIEDIHETIKIHPKYIKALENDDYSVFSGKVHAKGFLKVYAEYLKLDLEEILALWRREYESSFEKGQQGRFEKIKFLEPEKFVITPTLVIITTLSVVLLGFFSFLFIQYKQYTDAPTLDIYHPEDNQVFESDILDITGRVELDSEVFINNQKIIANPDGTFLTSVKLRQGINTISIKAINKLNKESEKLRTIIYRPKEEKPVIDAVEAVSEDGTGDQEVYAQPNMVEEDNPDQGREFSEE